MNEFIVWDEENARFSDLELFHNQIFINHEGKTKWFDHSGMSDADFQLKPFWYIGKTDIEDNKIYADCSIVEFLIQEEQGKPYIKCKGFFHYEEFLLSNVVRIFQQDGFKEWYIKTYDKDMMTDFKIIGTLQEDKHLLVDVVEPYFKTKRAANDRFR